MIDDRILSADDWENLLSSVQHALSTSPAVATGSSPSFPVLVAVAGVPGSGKTTLAKYLVQKLNERHPEMHAVSVSMDGYHMYRSELAAMSNSEEAFLRRGAEWTFNVSKLRDDLAKLSTTGELLAPNFDHAAKDPVEDSIAITKTNKIVVWEGLYLCLRHQPEDPRWDDVFSQFKMHVFIDCDLTVSTERLARRHMQAWGISYESAMERAGGSDYTNAKLVVRTKANADIVCLSISLS